MIAGVMTILFGSLLSRRMLIPKAGSWGKIGLLALVQTVGQYYFFFMALANTSGVRKTQKVLFFTIYHANTPL